MPIHCIILSSVPAEKKGDGRSRVDRDSDNQQLLHLEEKDVVSSVATVLSDLCGPGEWMPMEKLHAKVSFESLTNSHGQKLCMKTCGNSFIYLLSFNYTLQYLFQFLGNESNSTFCFLSFVIRAVSTT